MPGADDGPNTCSPISTGELRARMVDGLEFGITQIGLKGVSIMRLHGIWMMGVDYLFLMAILIDIFHERCLWYPVPPTIPKWRVTIGLPILVLKPEVSVDGENKRIKPAAEYM
jgi:hypothetical protein